MMPFQACRYRGSLWVIFGEVDSLGRVEILEVDTSGRYTGKKDVVQLRDLQS